MKKFTCLVMAYIMVFACFMLSGCDWLNRILGDDDSAVVDDGGDELPDVSDDPDDSENPEEPTEPDEPDATSLVSASEKKDLYEGTYESSPSSEMSYYGVGRTLNVIEDPFIEVTSGYKKVFDADKLLSLNWRKAHVGKMEASSHSAKSMEELFESLNNEYSVSFGVNFGIGVFSAGIKEQFSFATDEEYRETANEVFYTTSQIYSATLVEIDEYFDIRQFQSILSDDVLSDAKDVQTGRMSPNEFIYLYGTHAVLAGYYGGKIDATYYLRNKGAQWNESMTTKVETSITAGVIDLLSAETSVGFSVQEELGLSREETEERFMANALGGANFEAQSLGDFLNNYGKWVDSMNDAENFGVIVGLPKRSLVAIWDLFPSQYSSAQMILEEYFEGVAEETESEFLRLYERYYTEPVDRGDTENFDGGHGTQESPYIIKTKDHFNNIKNVDTEDAYFRLDKSISLGSWSSPFSFSGILDGNGNTITYAQTLSSTGDYYGGLFTELNGASIENLVLDVDISRDESGGTGYIGGLAGEMSGDTIVSRVAVDGAITIDSGSGREYVGGLIGRMSGGSIDECEVVCNIDIFSKCARGGGIVGYVIPQSRSVSINDCSHVGTITCSSAYIVNNGIRIAGGIIGCTRNDISTSISVSNCIHSGTIKLKWTGWAASGAGTHGAGGIVGRYEDGKEDGLQVENCYWQNSHCSLSGNAKDLNKRYGKESLLGTLDGFDTETWILSDGALPKLSWCNE